MRIFSTSRPSVATVGLAEAVYIVSEGEGSVEVCVELSHLPSGGLQWELVVTINTTDGPKASELQYAKLYRFLWGLLTQVTVLFIFNVYTSAVALSFYNNVFVNNFAILLSFVLCPILFFSISSPVFGVDFNTTSLEVTFPTSSVQGDTACGDIIIVDDNVLECNHSFSVHISATLGSMLTIVYGTITILDNDSKYCTRLYCCKHFLLLAKD